MITQNFALVKQDNAIIRTFVTLHIERGNELCFMTDSAKSVKKKAQRLQVLLKLLG